MKLSFAAFALASAQGTVEEIQFLNGEDRSYTLSEANFQSLKFLVGLHFKIKGLNDFDHNKYFRYGCHCFIMNGDDIFERGQGRPVDALDNKCKAYKDCRRCVREKHAEECAPSPWLGIVDGNIVLEEAAPGSCERDLFECDYQFAKGIFAERDTFNEEFHHLQSTIGFNREEDTFCSSNGGSSSDHQCCGGFDAPWRWINLSNNKCCMNGESGVVVGADDQC